MRNLLFALLLLPLVGLTQTQEDIWQFSHSVDVSGVDTPWLAPGCHVYPHSSGTVARVVPNCQGTTADTITWTNGSIAPYYHNGAFTSQTFGSDDLSDLSLIIPSFPNEGGCGVRPRYNQYADIDGDGVNERVVQIYGCHSDVHTIDSYVLDHDGTDWQYTHHPDTLLFAADTNNNGQLQLVDLMNDFNVSYIGDGYFKYLDLDNNGYRDFSFFGDHDTEWGIWLNNAGTYSQLLGSIVNPNGRNVQFPDFNNDGKLDLVVLNGTSLNFYVNVVTSPGTWVTTGTPFGYELILNGQAIAFHPEDTAARALVVGDPVHVAGTNPVWQVVAKTTPPLQGDPVPPPPPPDPDPDPDPTGGVVLTGWVFVTDDTDSCDTGDIRLKCQGTDQWVPAADAYNHAYIGAANSDLGSAIWTTPWVALDNLTENHYVVTCDNAPTQTNFWGCYPNHYYQQGTSGEPPPPPGPVIDIVLQSTTVNWYIQVNFGAATLFNTDLNGDGVVDKLDVDDHMRALQEQNLNDVVESFFEYIEHYQAQVQ